MNRYKVLVLNYDVNGNEIGQTEYEVFAHHFDLKEVSTENDSECHYFYKLFADAGEKVLVGMFNHDCVAGVIQC